MKKPTAFRLSENCLRLLVVLGEKLGLSQASVIEMAVRLLAERYNVKADVQSVQVPPLS
jgi:hypothetical protein